MKRIAIPLLIILIFTTLQSCSSVKVLDAWKSDDVSTVADNNFLVIARTSNKQGRIAFENEIVNKMTAEGYSATASFRKFGSMKPDEKPSEEDANKIIDLLKTEGFDAVVLTVLKDYQEETRTTQEGGYYVGGNYWNYYPRYYGGFRGYYYHPMAMSTIGTYVEPRTVTSTSKIYIVETTIYDLNRPKENQLVAVVTSKLDNPSGAEKTAKDYVNKIVKSLKK